MRKEVRLRRTSSEFADTNLDNSTVGVVLLPDLKARGLGSLERHTKNIFKECDALLKRGLELHPRGFLDDGAGSWRRS